MNKATIVTIVGTRPEIIRLSRVIARLDQTFNHIFVHTGQNTDPNLNEIFFSELEVRASWTPTSGENIASHIKAWVELLEMSAGLAPIPEGVTQLSRSR